MIVLSESSPQLTDSPSARDLKKSTEAARLAGAIVKHIPQDFPEGVSARDALWHIPKQETLVAGVWIGYIPYPEHYEQVYGAALEKNIRLVNNPVEYRNAEEFDRFYPLLGNLTPDSRVVDCVEEGIAAADELGYPVFLKGTIQSMKGKGLNACVANSSERASAICRLLLSMKRRSLGKVIVRNYIPLRSSRVGPGDFPFGREYRVFTLNTRVIGMGYYWEGEDDLAALDSEEMKIVHSLASEAASRVGTPYLSVDIGQAESGDWLVIEVGDGQFSGLSKVPIHELWHNLSRELDSI